MEYSSVLLTFLMCLKISTCLRCYKCSPTDHYVGERHCKHFDNSDKFLAECEHSTMCFKRQTTLYLDNGVTSVSIQRDCAPQTIPGDQAKINGKWQQVDTIYEAYNEGCKEDEIDPERPIKIENCYCRGDNCNRSNINIFNTKSFVFLLLIYLVS